MLEPPDVAEVFASDEERADAIVELVTVDRQLREWRDACERMSDDLPLDLRRRLLHQGGEFGDSPEARLARWVNIFIEDLEMVHDTRSRVVHGLRTADGEIRGAIWLGRRLLELLEGPAA